MPPLDKARRSLYDISSKTIN